MTELHWLPDLPDWRERVHALADNPDSAWPEAMALAKARMNFVRTNALDQAIRQRLAAAPAGTGTRPVRLGVLGSATLSHLLASIRVGGLRRGIWVDTYEGPYGQYWQEITDPASGLHAFAPTAILLSLDAHHVCQGLTAALDTAAVEALLRQQLDRMRAIWRTARAAFHAPVLQQTILPVHPPLLGDNEHRLPGSRARFITRLNAALRALAEDEKVDLLTIDDRALHDGVRAWNDPALWFRTRQEIHPTAAPFYGDLVGRWLAAGQGRSAKCLVMDLDNTLWGGVIGDDGLDGIEIGQGTPLGEAHLAVQQHARDLSERGVILAVCSKNDHDNAMAPFERHPDMLLKRADIACFVANWSDKAANLRAIAEDLNIGLDSLVFLDDNPFERNLVRRELPMVAVPELGDDPAGYVRTLTDAGYFESLAITAEDRVRSRQYADNNARIALKGSATDLDSYLRALDMRLLWRPFDRVGLERTVQLINKSNQFNLTTRRYTEAEIQAVMDDPNAIGLQLRLTDRFGDNGVIAIIIARGAAGDGLDIDTWVMSCRVLGRQVEQATLNVIMCEARRMGARRVIGTYIPTQRNGMVKDHYRSLGFTQLAEAIAPSQRYGLDVASFQPPSIFIDIVQG